MAIKKRRAGRKERAERLAKKQRNQEKEENQKVSVARPRRRAEIARAQLRDGLWADAEDYLWHRTKELGFTTIPRTLMLIATLIKELTKKGDASRVYLDLWARAFDEGLVEVFDESEFALSSGYSPGRRNVRTWRERIKELQRLKFIAVRPKAGRDIGYILLLHPHVAVLNLAETDRGRIPDWWWELFSSRIREIRAALPSIDGIAEFLETANGPVPKEVRDPLAG